MIHLVYEGRGLDVNPSTIDNFRGAGDTDNIVVLETIHYDDVTHITTGHRWSAWVHAWVRAVDRVETFPEEVRQG